MVDCFYILLLTRGLYAVLDGLEKACTIEAESCRNVKAQLHPDWAENAEFCEEAIAQIQAMGESLRRRWDAKEKQPNTARRTEAVIGGLYPLPGGGVYIPKQ